MKPQREWNAQAYHRVSEPQFRWGLKVLKALELRGDEYVMDAGCGSGRLTEMLLERLPRGRVLAVDVSENMLAEARQTLAAQGDRVRFQQADLAELTVAEKVDVIFSTATLHWVLDHDRLFKALGGCLVPGGRLHAQCGGAGNLDVAYGRAERILREPAFRPFIGELPHPTYFASPEATRPRLEAAGFGDIDLSLEDAPTTFEDRTAYRDFIEAVILRVPLVLIQDEALREGLLDRMCALSEQDSVPWSLDYVRLNLRATKL